jgi:hypothetical protein
MMTSFKFARLQQSVRAATDAVWMRIQKLTRLFPTEMTEELQKEFKDLICKHCTFYDSFDHPEIPKSALVVVSRREARNMLRNKKIELLKQHGNYSMRKAEDLVRPTGGEWQAAQECHSLVLDRQYKEPSQLYFFKGATYETTYNHRDECFSHTQLAILVDDPPSEEHLKSFKPIRLLVAPPGNKISPPDGVTEQELLSWGWSVQRVGTTPSTTDCNCGPGMKGRR